MSPFICCPRLFVPVYSAMSPFIPRSVEDGIPRRERENSFRPIVKRLRAQPATERVLRTSPEQHGRSLTISHATAFPGRSHLGRGIRDSSAISLRSGIRSESGHGHQELQSPSRTCAWVHRLTRGEGVGRISISINYSIDLDFPLLPVGRTGLFE